MSKQAPGELLASHFVTCGGCDRQEHFGTGDKWAALADATRLGWKRYRERGYLCPACSGERPPETSRETAAEGREV